MKINDIVVTFWFNKVVDIKNKIDIFEKELSDYFHGINSIGVPADINPDYPRLTAISDGGHTKLNISMINLQLVTNYDSQYNTDYSKCFEYIEQRAIKIYETISTKLGLDILYSAIIVVCEVEDENPVSMIKDNLLSSKLSGTYCEIGVRTSETINDKYYRNIAINSAKQITLSKMIEPGQTEIIMPLISLAEANVDKESIMITYEINDKYSFDTNIKYKLNQLDFQEMLNEAKQDIEENILNIVK